MQEVRLVASRALHHRVAGAGVLAADTAILLFLNPSPIKIEGPNIQNPTVKPLI